MMFKINVAKYFYNIVADKDEIAAITALGFSFHPNEDNEEEIALDFNCDAHAHFSTMDELMTFVQRFKKVVLTEKSITIYNDYIE